MEKGVHGEGVHREGGGGDGEGVYSYGHSGMLYYEYPSICVSRRHRQTAPIWRYGHSPVHTCLHLFILSIQTDLACSKTLPLMPASVPFPSCVSYVLA